MRIVHRIIAAMGGYFWLPCPVCGKHYGGHETSLEREPLVVEGHAWMTCSDACGVRAGQLNDANGVFPPYPYRQPAESRLFPGVG